ncbi:FecCD family ABC transporter permease [Paenibacillus abyssi]|uniref:Iron ABC transporter permease n=1 Tax=Paenibacillus abyssi TaxID=1340531 RepID=A0A917D2P3_9BACL|nr:iron ABC transporter permease [Paenibacillus abyssi]GGG08395.1 iron ABC transporter permease [Paenibacillus abyssi]
MTSIPSNHMERRKMARAATVMAVLVILIGTAFIISMNTGHVKLTPVEVWNTFWGNGTDRQELILFDFRLPRIVLSILVGAGLAVSGCILQGISRNALAEPGILGINAGAGLAVVLYISFFSMNTAAPVFFLPVFALIGAGLTAALIYILSYSRQRGLSPTRLLVVGIAVAAGISSAMLVLTIRLDPMQYQFVSLWLAGSIWGSNWNFVLALLPWLLVLLPLVFLKARVLNVMALGEHTASGLGAHVERQRLILLAMAVGLAGSSVAVGGGIAFVGLIGPHLARRIVGHQHQYALPVSALMGALLLITADTLARSILQPAEIPTGIVTAIIGAPYFLFLLAKSKS